MSLAAPSLFQPLPHRSLLATSVTVRDLIQQVREGRIRTQEVERPLRWRARHNLELFDSIWRGYPIGSLLFWKRPAPPARVELGAAHVYVPELSDAWWVVDGQQRITALAAGLLDVAQPEGEHRWSLFFDPVQQQFHEWTASPDASWAPLAVLGDLRRFIRWARARDIDDEVLQRLEEAQQRLLDYAVPASVVDTESEDAVRGIFVRLNTTGVQMQADEAFPALHGLALPRPRGHRLDLERLQRAFDHDGFGEPPRAWVLKMVLAMSGQDPTRRPERLPLAARLVSPEDAEEAIVRTSRFFRLEVGIPHLRLVPYPAALLVVGRWFLFFPDSDEWTRRRLAHWVWRAAAASAQQRAELSRPREQLRDVQDGEEVASLKRLLSRLPGRPTGGWTLGRFDGRSTKARIEILALLDRKPRVLPTPIGPQEAEGDEAPAFVDARVLLSLDRPASEVLRAPLWADLPAPLKDLARTAANRVLVDGGASDSHRLRRLDPVTDADVLQSHLLSEAFDALARRDVRGFLLTRAGVVRHWVEGFLERRAAWDVPLGLQSVDAYLDEKEE